ncbi:hypothetical protein NFI96_027084 [Prochilodus magdalenae]|nr:hypothetical protein NFI96_027084 [Prochilodus magdalenae]
MSRVKRLRMRAEKTTQGQWIHLCFKLLLYRSSVDLSMEFCINADLPQFYLLWYGIFSTGWKTKAECWFVAGSRSKSIRTEERWFTPEEFVKQEVTLTDGHWKKHIRCHDKTVSYLLKKKILAVHSLLCSCNLCSTRDQDKLNQNNDDECFICDSNWGDLLCCDECPRAFHHLCHIPAMQNDALGIWFLMQNMQAY